MGSPVFRSVCEAVSGLTYRTTVIPDCHYVGSRLRAADLAEVRSRGSDPVEAVIKGYVYGDRCVTILAGGEPICVYGAVSTGQSPKSASVWMLGTDGVYANRRDFIKDSRERVHDLIRDYELVWNYVDSRNHLHVRWLRWLGFTFIRSTTELSVDGTPYYEFAKLTHV